MKSGGSSTILRSNSVGCPSAIGSSRLSCPDTRHATRSVLMRSSTQHVDGKRRSDATRSPSRGPTR
eukprot:8944408-Pyramimonas_sp.AAC.1